VKREVSEGDLGGLRHRHLVRVGGGPGGVALGVGLLGQLEHGGPVFGAAALP
jgi:hypothetical protein